MKTLAQFIYEDCSECCNCLAKAPVYIGSDSVKDLEEFLISIDFKEIVNIEKCDYKIYLCVPEEAAPDDAYAVQYLEEIKEQLPQKWTMGQIKNCL